jgi:hypothetical protein
VWPVDAGEFRRMESALDELARRRFVVFPFAGFFGQSAQWPVDPARQEQYLRYVLARLGPYWNLLFNVAGPEPLIKPHNFQDAMGFEDLCRLGSLIHRLDPFGHLVTVHNSGKDTATGDPFADEEWCTFSTLQGPKTADLQELYRVTVQSRRPGKPIYTQETLWSGNKYHPDYSDDQLRRNAIVLTMAGCAINFADNGPVGQEERGVSSDGFSGTLDLADCVQNRHDILKQVWDLLEGLSVNRMRPAPEVVDAGFCLAEHGVRYLVYLPDGGSVRAELEGGPYALTWVNARKADERIRAGEVGGGRAESPGKDGDWLGLFERTRVA